MKQYTNHVNVILLVTFVCFGLFVPQTPAQQPVNNILVLSPEAAKVPVHGTVRFRAQLFGISSFNAVTADRIDWAVEPKDLGRITDDGFFIAGDRPGSGAVIATAKLLNREIKAKAKIVVGEADIKDHRLELVVVPEKAALGFGDSLRFHVKLSFKNSDRVVPNLLVNWLVKPRKLGKINQRGLFVAGNDPLQGEVIAYVEYNGVRIFGNSKVIVGARPNSAAAGKVTDEITGLGIQDAQVVAHRLGHVRWSRRTQTDSAGNYLLDKLIPGKYVLWANGKDYIVEYFEEAENFNGATPLEIAENDTLEGINFTLNHGGVITGTVYSDVDSLPLPRALVSAFRRLTTNVNSLKNHSVTDENGNYVISNLRTGDYVVVADKPGYQHEFYDDVTRPDSATLVHVDVPDTTKGIDFALSLHGAISGRVVVDNDTQDPIKGAIVFARDLNNPRPDRDKKVRTNENGEYLLELNPGFYIIGAEAKDYNNEFYDDVFDPALATPVQVIESEHTGDINMALAPLSSMSGVVNDDNGNPIVGAVVYAYPEVGQGKVARTETNESGEFLITGLYHGIYFAKAKAKGYHHEFYLEAQRLSEATPISVGINENIEDIDFTLTLASAIEGIVVSEEDGNPPLARALVVAKMIGSPFQKKTFSNDDGTYRIDNLPAGSYLVYSMTRGFYREFYDNVRNRDEATPVVLETSEVKTGIDFSLLPIPDHEGSITGLITANSDSLPIPGAIVVAVAKKGGPPFFGVTGADGIYEVKGLPNGDYFVMAWADGYIGEFYDNVYNWRKATLVNVVSPNETPNIDFGLAKKRSGPYRVRGLVMGRDNQPIANVLVYAQSKRGIDGFAVSDNEGHYEINELAAGDVNIIATAPGLKQNNDNNPTSNDSIAVSLKSGNDNFQANITMEPDVTTSVEELGHLIPDSYGLDQNYPNPFNPETAIQLQLPVNGDVVLKVYNILGQEIATLINENLEAGNHVINWNGLNNFQHQVPSGIYYYRIQVKNGKDVMFEQVRKMTLLK